MIRYLTWRNIFGVLLLAILVMIWPLEWIGWYSLQRTEGGSLIRPRFYVSTSKSIIKALINMRSFEIQLSPIG